MEPLETHYFECECYSDEHALKFTFDPDDGELYLSVFLQKRPFFKRLWAAIKYVFGYKSKYGDFESGTVFKPEDLEKLANLALRSKERRELLENK